MIRWRCLLATTTITPHPSVLSLQTPSPLSLSCSNPASPTMPCPVSPSSWGCRLPLDPGPRDRLDPWGSTIFDPIPSNRAFSHQRRVAIMSCASLRFSWNLPPGSPILNLYLSFFFLNCSKILSIFFIVIVIVIIKETTQVHTAYVCSFYLSGR